MEIREGERWVHGESIIIILLNCLFWDKQRISECLFKMSPILLYVNIMNHHCYLNTEILPWHKILFYKEEKEKQKVAIDINWFASLWIVKFKRSIYTCRHSIRRSNYEHANCLHPIEEVSIYTNDRATARSRRKKKRTKICRCRDVLGENGRAFKGTNQCQELANKRTAFDQFLFWSSSR